MSVDVLVPMRVGRRPATAGWAGVPPGFNLVPMPVALAKVERPSAEQVALPALTALRVERGAVTRSGPGAVTVVGATTATDASISSVDRFMTVGTLKKLAGRPHDVVLRVIGDGYAALDERTVVDTADATQQFVIGPLTIYS